jgi:hypothetical protein
MFDEQDVNANAVDANDAVPDLQDATFAVMSYDEKVAVMAKLGLKIGVNARISIDNIALAELVAEVVNVWVAEGKRFSAWEVNEELRKRYPILNIVQDRVRNQVTRLMDAKIADGLDWTTTYDHATGPIGATFWHVRPEVVETDDDDDDYDYDDDDDDFDYEDDDDADDSELWGDDLEDEEDDTEAEVEPSPEVAAFTRLRGGITFDVEETVEKPKNDNKPETEVEGKLLTGLKLIMSYFKDELGK